jgi:methyl-accepting chemotaxis protein
MRIFHLMRQFSIRFRMLSAIAVVLLLLGLLGGAGLLGMFRIYGMSVEVVNKAFASVERVSNLRYELSLVRRYEKEMIIQYEKPETIKQIRGIWLSDLQLIEGSMKELFEQSQEADKATVQQVMVFAKKYQELFSLVAQQLESSAYETATTANRMSGRAAAEFTAADDLLRDLEKSLRAGAKQAGEDQHQALNQTLLLFGALVVLTVLMVAPLTLLNMQAICQPLAQAQGLAQAIASGDLSQSIQVEGRDEVSDLQHALDNMRNGLGSMVSQVRDSSENIAMASREIALGNQDLSARTEQTASNVQKTVSSIASLSEHVQQTATSAGQANQLATTTSQAAQRGGSVVEQAVKSMHSISQASHKINDIIGLIDAIAFQTNILALNAAVEAARAGEQGRGFAVVATEVRELAQRSAAAASEIKGLISNSVAAVDGGVKLVEEAGKAMQEIVSGVQHVSTIINEITVAASSQSQGIGHVSQAVHEIDQMTQQNAALVEESAAAAESMREQADRLAQVVRQFRVSSQA